MNINQLIGQSIRQYRKEKGLTQSELALMVGYKRAISISEIEAGENPITVQIVYRIAAVLGVQFLDLLPSEIWEDATEIEKVLGE